LSRYTLAFLAPQCVAQIAPLRSRGVNSTERELTMKRLLLASLLSIALLSPIQTLAWGRNGHETVGYVAASLIAGTNAGKEVKKLLKPGETMATAAEWPDCAKGFRYCHKPPTPEMQDFAARNPQHHNYHYTDVAFQQTEYDASAIGANPDDVVHILGDAILVLKGQPSSNPAHNITKREALFILAHMVGDIHQPLHVGAAYVDSGDQFVVLRRSKRLRTSSRKAATSFAPDRRGCIASGTTVWLPAR
jgi:S1/P1 Nuclease